MASKTHTTGSQHHSTAPSRSKPSGPSPPTSSPPSSAHIPPSIAAAKARTNRSLQTTAHFLILFNVYGIPLSFGPYLEYYHTSRPHLSLPQIAAVSALQLFSLFSSLGFAVLQYQSGYWKSTSVVAGAVVVVCQFALPACKDFVALLLVQGLGVGMGLGVLGGLSTLCLASHYRNNVPLVSMQGVSYGLFGALVFTAVPYAGFQRDNFALTVCGSAGLSLATLLIALFMLRRSKTYPRFDFRRSSQTFKFQGQATLVFMVGYLWVFMGLFTFPVYIVLMLSSGPGYAWPATPTSMLMGAYAAGTFTASEVASRRTRTAFGPVNSFTVAAIAAGTCFLNPAWMPYTHVAWPCVIVYGLALGAILALYAKVTTVFHWSRVAWHPDMTLRMIVFMALAGLAAGAGILTTALIVEHGDGDFRMAMTLPGATMIAGGLLVFWARYKRGGRFFMAI
ncbi:hypothetical protein BDV96DRAFT_583523 [Lophiotrema nucula]|uniref:Major facilitator superfamily domain-containing protein n=1 Tax=Lophiotrema nucula TaxID=690887 RepID=A0A6A5YU51_9PLEO|nr:hypothetical protein BDV96DRAFT_583523 [Lophiotrema nucula]